MKKIFLFCVLALFFLNSVTALDLNPFAEKKNHLITKENVEDNFLKENFNEKYGVIRISKSFLWGESNKIAEYSLIENTEDCLKECSARGRAILYDNGTLFDDIKFKDNFGKNKLLDFEIYIKEKINKTIDKPIFKQKCQEDEKNETNICFDEIEKYQKETVETEEWVKYK